MYMFDPNDHKFNRHDLNVNWERAVIDSVDFDTGLTMIKLPTGRELLAFEGDTKLIARIVEAVKPTLNEIQSELKGGE